MIIHSKHMTYEACVNFTVKYRHHYSLIIISIFEIESFKDLWGPTPKTQTQNGDSLVGVNFLRVDPLVPLMYDVPT